MNIKTNLRSSPHLKKPVTVPQIMRNVVYALLPVCAFSIYAFGLSVLLLILTTVLTCILTELLFCRLSNRPSTLSDWSIVITAILLALTLPPGFPLWMAAVAAFISVALGKSLFGGLGYNVMNPALVGRAFAQAAFPVAITTWSPPFLEGRFTEVIPSTLTPAFMQPIPIADWLAKTSADAVSGATPLALQKFEQITTPVNDMLFGMTSGSAGETSALLILLGGIYLSVRKMMNWRIPAAVLVGAVVVAAPFWLIDSARYPDPLFVLFSGGLMLGAVFMASDMVASPVTPKGIWIYGLFIGGLTTIIRLFGGLTEGVMYAILLGNVLSPIISSYTQPTVFGAGRKHE